MAKANPELRAEIVRLRETTSKSYREIAVELGVSRSAVAGHCQRASGYVTPAQRHETPRPPPIKKEAPAFKRWKPGRLLYNLGYRSH